MKRVLTLLRRNRLYTKESKCSFGGSKFEYLGYVISAAGVATDPLKIEVLRGWPKPTTVK